MPNAMFRRKPPYENWRKHTSRIGRLVACNYLLGLEIDKIMITDIQIEQAIRNIRKDADAYQQFSLWPQAILFPAFGVGQLSFSDYETSPPT